jgi:hypothetical protein
MPDTKTPESTKDFLQVLSQSNNESFFDEKLYGFVPGGWLPDWVKQGYNQSIEGMAREVLRGKPVFNVDQNYDPNMLEDIGATVVSFLTPTDVGSMFLGGGIGGLAVKKMATKKLIQSGINDKVANVAVGTGFKRIQNQKERAAKLAVKFNRGKVMEQAGAKATTGASGLGFYSGLQSMLGQEVTNDDISLVQTVKDATIGATLGAATGGVGAKVSAIGKAKGYTPKQIMAMEKGAEVGVFGTAGPILEGELPSAESYIHAAGVIGGLAANRAISKRILEPPKKFLKGELEKQKLNALATARAEQNAMLQRKGETWINREGREVRILTDWFNSRRNQEILKIKDVKTGKTEKIPKSKFFDKGAEWRRKNDTLGRDVLAGLQKRSFEYKRKGGISDLEFKNMVDRAEFGGEGSFGAARKYKGKQKKREFHTDYEKLSYEGKQRLLNNLEMRKDLKADLKKWESLGFKIPNASYQSVLQEHLPSVYNVINGLKPKWMRISDNPITQAIVKKFYDLDARQSQLNRSQFYLLNKLVYYTKDGKSIKGLSNLNEKQATELGADLRSADPAARSRSRNYKRMLNAQYRIAEKAGVPLAEKVEDYFPRFLNKKIANILRKDISKIIENDKDLNMFGSKLADNTAVASKILAAREAGSFSPETIKALDGLVKQFEAKDVASKKRAYAKAFQIMRDEVFGEYISVNHNLEVKRRKHKLPDELFETDSRFVLPNYASQLSKRAAYVEVAGKKGDKIYKDIKALESDKVRMYEEAELLRKAFDAYTGKIELDKAYNWKPKSQKLLNDMVNFQVATKIGLGFATIPNLTQVFISSALRAGYAPFIRGSYNYLTSKKYRNQMEKHVGAGSLELHQMLSDFHAADTSWWGKRADQITTISGFKGINRVNMLVSAYTGYEAALRWQKIAKTSKYKARRNWAKENLKDMGVTDINQKLNQKVMSRAMYEFARDTQLQKNVMREPDFANDPRFRPFFLFKRFGYRQFEYLTRELNKEVRRGNAAIVLRLAAGGMAGGMFVNGAKRFFQDLISGEDIFDEQYKVGEDEFGFNDILDNFGAVGAFGLVSDIVASESKWRALEFAAKPAIVQDALKAYDAMQKLMKDTEDFGLGFHTMQRSLKNIAPIFGTVPRRAAQQVQTKGQRESYVKFRYSKIHPRILDYMIDGNDRMARRLIREWNRSFPERPIMYDDIGPKAINRRLENKYEKRMNP